MILMTNKVNFSKIYSTLHQDFFWKFSEVFRIVVFQKQRPIQDPVRSFLWNSFLLVEIYYTSFYKNQSEADLGPRSVSASKILIKLNVLLLKLFRLKCFYFILTFYETFLPVNEYKNVDTTLEEFSYMRPMQRQSPHAEAVTRGVP